MAPPGQERDTCDHTIVGFDSPVERCMQSREIGLGNDP